jgi:hypothetical protein
MKKYKSKFKEFFNDEVISDSYEDEIMEEPEEIISDYDMGWDDAIDHVLDLITNEGGSSMYENVKKLKNKER